MATYSIHLDELDLALLPVARQNYDFLKKEYFEFQLFAKKEDLPVYPMHPCHICAIEVPAAFWSAHCEGAKHRANARIAAAAAQRTSAFITATPPPHTPPATERFCDSCTCIASDDHEKTKEHKLSVVQDRMLNDLVMIYTGDLDNDWGEIKNESGSKQPQIYTKDVSGDDLSLDNDECLSDNNEKITAINITNENTAQDTDDVYEDETKPMPSKDAQSSSLEAENNKAMTSDQKETYYSPSTIAEGQDAVVNAKKRTRKRKKKNNISTTEETNVEKDAASRVSGEKVAEENNPIRDVFVSYYPLVDESAIHYPFVKDALQVRCLVCDCVVPRTAYNRDTHLKGRRHAANGHKQLDIIKDAFILAKKQMNND